LDRTGTADPSSSRKAAEYEDAGRACQFAPARPINPRFGLSLTAGKKSVLALANTLVLVKNRSLSAHWANRAARPAAEYRLSSRNSAANWQRNLWHRDPSPNYA
jgi:hypothetical protein